VAPPRRRIKVTGANSTRSRSLTAAGWGFNQEDHAMKIRALLLGALAGTIIAAGVLMATRPAFADFPWKTDDPRRDPNATAQLRDIEWYIHPGSRKGTTEWRLVGGGNGISITHDSRRRSFVASTYSVNPRVMEHPDYKPLGSPRKTFYDAEADVKDLMYVRGAYHVPETFWAIGDPRREGRSKHDLLNDPRRPAGKKK